MRRIHARLAQRELLLATCLALVAPTFGCSSKAADTAPEESSEVDSGGGDSQPADDAGAQDTGVDVTADAPAPDAGAEAAVDADASAGDAGDASIDADADDASSTADADDGSAAEAATDAKGDSPFGVVFDAVPPAAYVTKIKNLLTGYPATQAEIDAVVANPQALRGLIDGWLSTPEAQSAILAFFKNAFQQSHLSAGSFGNQLNYFNTSDWVNNTVGTALTQSFQESFSRTAWQRLFVDQQGFDGLFTTRTYMMTTAMLSSMLFIERNTGSYGSGSVYADNYGAELSQMVVTNTAPIPITDTLDPNSPNYLHWYIDQATPCGDAILGKGNHSESSSSLYQLLLGLTGTLNQVDGKASATPPMGQQVSYCTIKNATTQFAPTDLTDWRMVTFRDLAPGEKPTRFWDLPTLRAADDAHPLPLRTQRVGPFTTPAFFANWDTNVNNQSRVTMNQTLVVALGESFDGSEASAAVFTGTLSGQDLTGSDSAHAGNPACAGCHAQLDPMRRFFSQTYSFSSQVQTNATLQGVYGAFNYDGVNKVGNSLYDLGNILAQHPSMPGAWVQKLCYWADSAKCSEDDPEFIKLSTAFASGFDFRTLLLDLLSSPMITGASRSKTYDDRGEVVSIARLDHWCTSLNNRLGLTNACTVNGTAVAVSPSVPSDGYTRGVTEPFLPTTPSIFTRGATEQICWALASALVDIPPAKGTSRYSSKAAVAAIDDMITVVMGIPSTDVRYAQIVSLLHNHFADAVVGGASPTQALQSTFTLACTSPTSVAIGL